MYMKIATPSLGPPFPPPQPQVPRMSPLKIKRDETSMVAFVPEDGST